MCSWPSGLRRCIKAAVSSEAWVRIPSNTISFFPLSLSLLLRRFYAFLATVLSFFRGHTYTPIHNNCSFSYALMFQSHLIYFYLLFSFFPIYRDQKKKKKLFSKTKTCVILTTIKSNKKTSVYVKGTLPNTE